MNLTQSTDDRISSLIKKYATNKRTININFRKEVNWLASNRLTHQIHSYPAKLIMHIPHFFIANTIFSTPGDYVLDPFCGSGTVLLEAMSLKRKVIGADANPLARLITLVKTTPISTNSLKTAFSVLKKRIPVTRMKSLSLDVVNLNYWFSEHVTHELECIIEGIYQFKNSKYRNFFSICLSQIIRKVCRADPRLSVPVRLHYSKYPDGHWFKNKIEQRLINIEDANVREYFYDTVKNNIERLTQLNLIFPCNIDNHLPILYQDARQLDVGINITGTVSEKINDNSIQLIITSPPYSGAQKYLRATCLNLNWLNLIPASKLKIYNKFIIGREDYHKEDFDNLIKTEIAKADRLIENIYQINPLRAHICAQYLIDMRSAIAESFRVLKKGGYFIIICGNNTVCGRPFPTVDILSELITMAGGVLRLRLVDTIRSRGLMTKRNKTSSMITREWVLVFEKA